MTPLRSPPTIWVYRHNITHFIRIPLASPKSRSRLEKFLLRLKNDPLTSVIPYPAWMTVDSLGISLAGLSLPDSTSVYTACEILKNLDLPSKMRELPGKEPEISLHGLISCPPSEHRPFTNRLYVSLIHGVSVTLLRKKVREAFEGNGLVPTAPRVGRLFNPNEVQTPLKIMDTGYLRS